MPNLWGGVGGLEGCAAGKKLHLLGSMDTPPFGIRMRQPEISDAVAPWKSKYVEPIEGWQPLMRFSPLARRLNESDVGAEKGDEDAREGDCVGVTGEECFHVGFSVRAP